MTGTIKRTTANYEFRIPFFDAPNWGREMERNFDTIDAVLFAATGVSNVKGTWTNNTQYDVSDRVVDPFDGSLWQCNVAHLTPSTGSFEDERTAHPTYWTVMSQIVGFRGQWTAATNYNVNEFLYDTHRYGAVLHQYTSGASYDADVAAGNILTLIDLSQENADAAAAVAAAQASAIAADTSADDADISEANAAASAAAAAASATATANALGFFATTGEWTYENTTTAPPSSLSFRVDNASTVGAVTKLWLNYTAKGPNNVKSFLQRLLTVGTKIYMQGRSDTTKWTEFTVSAPIIDNTTYCEIPVTVSATGASLSNGAQAWITVVAGAGNAQVYVGDTAPAFPTASQLWWKSNTGQMFIYYNDGDSSQWVQANAPAKDDQSVMRKTARTRNRINNPTAQISQENDTTQMNTNGAYPADQCVLQFGGLSGSAQKAALPSPTPEGTSSMVAVWATVAKASLAATDFLQLTYPIEGLDVADFQWGTPQAIPTVLRFTASCPTPGTFPFAIANGAADRSFVGSYTITAANTPQTFSFPIPGDTTGTWAKNNTLGVLLKFGYAIGSNYVGVAGWQAGGKNAPPGMTNGAAIANNPLRVTDVGFYADPDNTGIAPPFNAPSYEDDLARCLRYWEPMVSMYYGNVTTATSYDDTRLWRVLKRTTPTIGSVSQGGAGNGSFNARSSSAISNEGMRTSGQAIATIAAAGWSDRWVGNARLI